MPLWLAAQLKWWHKSTIIIHIILEILLNVRTTEEIHFNVKAASAHAYVYVFIENNCWDQWNSEKNIRIFLCAILHNYVYKSFIKV